MSQPQQQQQNKGAQEAGPSTPGLKRKRNGGAAAVVVELHTRWQKCPPGRCGDGGGITHATLAVRIQLLTQSASGVYQRRTIRLLRIPRA